MNRTKLVPSLVKSVDIVTDHPGYRYNYFNSFAELDAYFTNECGSDWKHAEWAQFWLRDYWRSLKKENRVYRVKKFAKRKPGKFKGIHPELIAMLVKHYAQEEGQSLRAIARILQEDFNISVSYTTLAKLVKEKELPRDSE